MARKQEPVKLVTKTNTESTGFKKSREQLIEKTLKTFQKSDEAEFTSEENETLLKNINASCKILYNNNSAMYLSDIQDSKRIKLIKLPDYDKYTRNSDKKEANKKLIFRVERLKTELEVKEEAEQNDDIPEEEKKAESAGSDPIYTVYTGLYCGLLNFGEKQSQLEIRAGRISDEFFKRLLNTCCGIYADTSPAKGAAESHSVYSVIIQYLFLTSLRKIANTSRPKQYITVKERDYSIRGEIDINDYINHDLTAFDKKVTFKYQLRSEIQQMIDVLHEAVSKCRIDGQSDLPDILNLKRFLKEHYSGRKCPKSVINNITKNKFLYNSLYSDFKKPLQLAQILLSGDDLNMGSDTKKEGVSGYLIDASFLWEMYVLYLLRQLPNSTVEAQYDNMELFKGTFFGRRFYPDFVLTTSDGRVFVFDAKFKDMFFRNSDVDRDDIHQLRSYAYHFEVERKENFCGAALIYPTTMIRTKDDSVYDDGTLPKFGVFAVKDPYKTEILEKGENGKQILTETDMDENESFSLNENNFIKELSVFIG